MRLRWNLARVPVVLRAAGCVGRKGKRDAAAGRQPDVTRRILLS